MATKKKLVSKAKAPAKKTVAKKAPAKKVAKPAPKKAVAKAKVTKKLVVKAKALKTKAPAKKAVVKKVAPKKVTSRASVNVKKIAKPAPKKVMVKKVAPKKNTSKAKVAKKVVKVTPKKVAVKKVVVKKTAPTKAIVKPIIAKKIVSKPVEIKKAAPIVPVKQPKVVKTAKPAPAKKTIVAPTTFSKVAVDENTKNSKEPKGKFEMEFVIRASEDMVFEYVSTESGLSEWFCDDVNIKDSVFTFNWDGQMQQARLVKEVPPLLIRYQWTDKNDGSYFEFRTQKDDLTNDVSLIITDFADNKAEEESARLLWHSQIDKLLHVLGSFF